MKYYELFLRYPEFKTRAITLSFDDGYEEDRRLVETLNRHGMKCTFNLTSGRVEEKPNMIPFCDWAELYGGHEIAAHSYTHPHLNALDSGGIAYQIIKDRERLEAETGSIIQGFAYPFGLRGDAGPIVDCLEKCGIRYGRTTVSTYNFELPTDYLRWNPTCHQADSRLPELAEQFFQLDDVEHPWRIRPLLFYIWGHSYEFRDKWENIEDICRILGGNNRVWYATNGEIIDYISAFQSLRRSANGQIIHNPTDVDLYVQVNNKDVILEKGKTVDLERID